MVVEKQADQKYRVFIVNVFNSKLYGLLDADYNLGSRFGIAIDIVGGNVTVKYRNGAKFEQFTFGPDQLALNGARLFNCYFKIGNHLISQTSKEESETWVYSANVEHDYD